MSAQLEKLDETAQQKRAIGRFYDEALADVPHLRLPVPATDYADNIYWVYGVVLEESCPLDAAAMMQKLADERYWLTSVFLATARAAGSEENGAGR